MKPSGESRTASVIVARRGVAPVDFVTRGLALVARFSHAGMELSRVVELETVRKYDEALRGYFAKHGLTMTRLP